jgi:hypothetical protein
LHERAEFGSPGLQKAFDEAGEGAGQDDQGAPTWSPWLAFKAAMTSFICLQAAQ